MFEQFRNGYFIITCQGSDNMDGNLKFELGFSFIFM